MHLKARRTAQKLLVTLLFATGLGCHGAARADVIWDGPQPVVLDGEVWLTPSPSLPNPLILPDGQHENYPVTYLWGSGTTRTFNLDSAAIGAFDFKPAAPIDRLGMIVWGYRGSSMVYELLFPELTSQQLTRVNLDMKDVDTVVFQSLGPSDGYYGMAGDFIINGGTIQAQRHVASVPEPETYAMFLAGLGLMLGISRRRKA